MAHNTDPRLVLLTHNSIHAAYGAGRLFDALPGRWKGAVNVSTQHTALLSRTIRLALQGVSLRLLGHRILERLYITSHRWLRASRTGHSYPLDIERIASCFEVPVFKTLDINSVACLERVAAWKPDCIVSFLCPQIIDARLLQTARKWALNFHPSLLPRHRGIFPIFHARAAGDKQIGITIHVMNSSIDGGDILLQQEVPTNPRDSVQSLYDRSVRQGAALLIEALALSHNGTLSPQAQDEASSTYASWPDQSTYRRFKKSGGVLGSLKELGGIIDRYCRELSIICSHREVLADPFRAKGPAKRQDKRSS